MPDFDELHDDPLVSVTVLLADSAQVADGKLFVLGGGVTEVGPNPQPVALALLIDVPWDRANISHEWLLELVDEDGEPAMWDDQPVVVGGNFEAGRPVGALAGTPLRVPMAINFGALPVVPGKRYEWRFAVDGNGEPGWNTRFSVRQQPLPQ